MSRWQTSRMKYAQSPRATLQRAHATMNQVRAKGDVEGCFEKGNRWPVGKTPHVHVIRSVPVDEKGGDCATDCRGL